MKLLARAPRLSPAVRLHDVQGAIIVFCCGLAVTALTAYKLADIARERDRHDFEKHAAAARDAVLDRVQTSVALLRGTAGLIAAGGDTVSGAAFRQYIAQLSLREAYPGVLGIGYSRRLPPGEVAPFVAARRAEGRPDFRVWPESPRAEYHAIAYLEPMDERNSAAIGFDMYTRPTRAAAMARARDAGEPAATGRVTLIQEIREEKQPGFLIYLPVYRGGAVPASVEARRAALLGYAYSPLRAGDFLAEAFSHERGSPISTTVYDGERAHAEAMLFRHTAPAGVPSRPQFVQAETVKVAGTPWTLVFESARSATDGWATAVIAAVAGTLLSLVLALVTWREAQAKVFVAQSLARERAARNQAERASAIKDEFLATLSHELRTPLNAILGWAHVVQSGQASPEQTRIGLDAIERNARVQVRLIDELLDMSRIVAGKLELDMQAVDFGALVAAGVDSTAPAAQQKGLVLERKIASGMRVRGDPARLQQVVANLLTNAVKFTPQGGRITVEVLAEGPEVKLVVRDTGMGIEPEFLPYVFERFRQADPSRTRRHGGLGLGLSIVRHLVELHGGSVSVRSAGPGAGATFAVTLPAADTAALADEHAPGAESREPAPAADFTGMRILVVDDEQDARELVRHVLAQHGAQVEAVGSAEEALRAVSARRPQLVLSDIGMPGMDGYELVRRLRRDAGETLHAIAVSAYARTEDRRHAIDAGFDAYLVKPLHPASLLRAVSYFAARERRAEAMRSREAGAH